MKDPTLDLRAVAADWLPAVDPGEIMRRAGLSPDPWQRDFLFAQPRQALLLAARQSGKSSVTAAALLHRALFWPDSLCAVFAPSLRQAGELFKKILTFYRPFQARHPARAETQLSLTLRNGSRILSMPAEESNVRGLSSAAVLAIDEASRVKDDLYFAVRPMLAVSRGRLICLSTPYGARGWYFEEWRNGLNWERYTITAEKNPRVSAGFLEAERRSLGDVIYAQEYECSFSPAPEDLKNPRVFADPKLLEGLFASTPGAPIQL